MTSPVQKFSGDLNAYAAHIHELNLKWWTNEDGTPKDLDKGERFMLMVSELAEAMEGDRKDLMDDKLPQYKMIWVELADTVIRVMDSGHVYGWDFMCSATYAPLIKKPQTVGGELLNIVEQIIFLVGVELHTKSDSYAKSAIAMIIVKLCVELTFELGCTDFWQIVYEKLQYNWTRADHQHVNRQGKVGQKRY